MSDVGWYPTSDNRPFGYAFFGSSGMMYDESAEGSNLVLSQVNESTSMEATISADAKFALLCESWMHERNELGTVSDMVARPSYQKIIGMGSVALRPIFRRMESEGDEPDFWFAALANITCANPVADENKGNVRKMARDWLGWAARYGYI